MQSPLPFWAPLVNEEQWEAHLQCLGIICARHRRNTTEVALLGSILAHSVSPELAIINDDAGQFNVLLHGLCWVHAERLVHKLIPLNEAHRQDIDSVRDQIWSFYAELKAYKKQPTPEYPEYDTIKVLERRCEPTSPNTAIIVVTYTNDFGSVSTSKPTTNDGPEEKQIRFSVVERATTKDRNDADMLLTPPPTRSSWDTIKSEAQVTRPIGVLTFERTELTAPAQRMRDLVGKLNDSAEGPYAAGTLLFSALDASGNSEDGWQCIYEFSYDPDGWKHRDIYKSPADNRVPDDAIEQEFDVLDTANFGPLGFDWSD